MTLALWNLAAYSAQLAVLAATATAVTYLLRLNAPRLSVRYWQAVLAACFALPLLQTRTATPGDTIQASIRFMSNAAVPSAPDSPPFDATVAIAAILALGIVLRLAGLGMGLLRLRLVTRRAEPAAALAGLSTQLQDELGVRAEVLLSDDVEGPATVGWRRAVILLPRRIVDLPRAVQRAVLCHELLHVRRRDWLVTLGEELWCALFWFHPGVRLIASRACLARETVVDEDVILQTRDRRAYAEALLAFSHPQPHLVGATALIGRRHLSQRISLIAQEVSMSRSRVASLLTLSAVIVTAATISAAAAVPMVSSEAQSQQVYKPGDGITLPAVLREVKPAYTPEAMQQKIQGSVILGIVVLADGTVGDIIVEHSLDKEYGLDQEAIKAARQWTFKPGTKDGTPVPVSVTLQLTFTLKK